MLSNSPAEALEASAVAPDLVREELDRVLASPFFRNSQRRTVLLRFLVERYLRGESDPVKEHQIGIDAFDRPENWDPRIDPIVRVEFKRVRQKLQEYYESEGASDPVLIDFKSRGYLPVFTPRVAAAPPVVRRRWIWPAAAAAVLGIAGLAFLLRRDLPLFHRPTPVIAVLPFANLSNARQDEYLSEGFTDVLTDQLAGLSGLSVVARASAFQFRGKTGNLKEIGRTLDATYIIEGSVQRNGNALRVDVSLERPSDGLRLWGKTYDSDARDVFKVQGEVARSIAAELRVKLAASSDNGARDYEPSAEGYDLYLRGTYARDIATPAANREAIDDFERVVRLDPGYARAYTALGSAYLSIALGSASLENMRRAKEAYEHAVAINPGVPNGYTNLALLDYALDWNWPRAQSEFQHSLELAPTGSAYTAYALALTTRGEFEKARDQLRRGLLRDPTHFGLHGDCAFVLVKQGRYGEAEEHIQYMLSRKPRFFPGLVLSSIDLLYRREPAKLMDVAKQELEVSPHSGQGSMAMALAYAEAGDRQKALAIADRMTQGGADPGTPLFGFAVLHAILRDPDRTFEYLEKSAELHEYNILYLRIEPFFSSLQQDPRMIALERRVGLL